MSKIELNFKGKTALITGASRGIGEAIAKSLASLGAEVILVSRKLESLKEIEKQINDDGGKATAIACHTGNMDQINSLFKEIREKFGKIDFLVNNAATNPFFGDVLSVDEAAWDKTVSVNLRGYFFIAQKAAQIMKEHGGGSIVNVSSINGIRPAPFQGIYSITKAGVINMTLAFAKELAGHKIRVNAVLPGLTDTKFSSVMTSNEAFLNLVLPTIPMKRIAKPEEMVGAVLYLLSDLASYTTGSCLVVDGGMMA